MIQKIIDMWLSMPNISDDVEFSVFSFCLLDFIYMDLFPRNIIPPEFPFMAG